MFAVCVPENSLQHTYGARKQCPTAALRTSSARPEGERPSGFPGHLTDGGSEVKPGLTPGHHMRAAMIWDPEGNPIELFELAEAP